MVHQRGQSKPTPRKDAGNGDTVVKIVVLVSERVKGVTYQWNSSNHFYCPFFFALHAQ